MKIINLNNKEENQKLFNTYLTRLKNIRKKKFKLYGVAYREFGFKGIIIRMSDKMERLKNIIKYKNYYELNETIEETIEDTLLDLINYSIMALMELENKKFNGEKNENI